MLYIPILSFYIIEKAKLETLNVEALKWFSETISSSVNDNFLSDDNCNKRSDDIDNSDESDNNNKPAIIIVHGAGSFGHHTAKKYGLRGKTTPPPDDGMNLTKKMITGIAKTRHR